jgi:hypothetical protein
MNDASHLHQHVTHGGVTEHFVDGEHVSTIAKNVFGGHDVYHNGHLDTRTMPNVFHGHDVYHDGKLAHQTMPNVHGGKDSYHDGRIESSSIPNVHHGHDYYQGSHLVNSTIPSGHGFTTVMHHSDPLMHLQDYLMDPLHL